MWKRSAGAGLLILMVALSAQEGRAQSSPGQRSIGVAVGVMVPTGTFSEFADPGPTIAFQAERRLSYWFSLVAQGVVTVGLAPSDDLSRTTIPSVRVGGRFHRRSFFLGADGGYFFGSDLREEFSVLAVVGWDAGRFVVSADARLMGDARWVGAQLGYYLARF